MASRDDFDVLRLIEHGQNCYISSDNVSGMQLACFLKTHPDVDKETLFQWIRDITKQLSQIHKCRGQPSYQYVNPYSIVVTEEACVYFLDTGAGSSEELIREMQRRPVREHFLPPEEPYYQQASEELDIYGLGKTIQFLLAETEEHVVLSMSEEKKFQMIISRCLERHSKRAYTQVSEILKYLPKYRKKERGKAGEPAGKEDSRKIPKFLIPVGLAILLPVLIVTGLWALADRMAGGDIREAAKVAQEAEELFENAENGALLEETKAYIDADTSDVEEVDTTDEKSPDAGAVLTEEARLNLKLGALYFLKLEEYETSRSYFQAAGDFPLAQNMAAVCTYMIAGGEAEEETQIRQDLAGAKAYTETMDPADAADFYPCFLKAYLYMDSPEDAQEVLRLGKLCLEDAGGDDQAWIREGMAAAYEKQGDYESAADMCKAWLEAERDTDRRLLVYDRLAEFLESSGRTDEAREELKKGSKEFPYNSGLRIRYLKLLCQDSSIERSQCANEMTACMKELPDIREEETFQKLLNENGMKVKGEKVCVEK